MNVFSSELKKAVGISLGIRFNCTFTLKNQICCYLSVSDNDNDVYRGERLKKTNSSLKSSRLYMFTKEKAMSFLLLREGQVYQIFK